MTSAPDVSPEEAGAIRARLIELAGRPQPPMEHVLTQEALSRLQAMRVDSDGYLGVHVPALAATQVTWTAMMSLVDAVVTPEGRRITVHAYEDVRLVRPLRAGETYTSRATLTGVQPSRSGTRLAFTITADDVSGRPVIDIVNTAYVRGVWADVAWGHVATEPGGPRAAGELQRTTFVLKPTVTEEYAEVSGDHNPVHLSDVPARAVGLPGRIVHGLCTFGAVARAVLDLQDLSDDDVHRVWARFRDIVLPGDRLDVDVSSLGRRLTAIARTGRGTVAEECVIDLADPVPRSGC